MNEFRVPGEIDDDLRIKHLCARAYGVRAILNIHLPSGEKAAACRDALREDEGPWDFPSQPGLT